MKTTPPKWWMGPHGLYGEFMEQVTATVEGHGGKFVARGGDLDIVEGDWKPQRIAILRFDSVERVREWLSSPEYVALNEIRTRSSNISMVVIEGV